MPATNEIEFFTQRPSAQIPYTTVELYHPDFGLHRYVAGQALDVDLRLEVGAPRDSDTVVTFSASNLQAPQPKQGREGARLEIQLGLAGQQVKEKINMITDAGRLTPISVVWRRHISGITYPTTVYYMQSAPIVLDNRAAAIAAEEVNMRARSASRRYKSDEFPGLSVSL